MRLLLVEDDIELGSSLRSRLQAAGYAVDLCDNGIDGEHMGQEEPYDLVILDLGLPGRAGLEVLRHWRAHGIDTPVMILTARDAWHQRVDGLRAGADDYLGKPFHHDELAARIEALLRRSSGRAGGVPLQTGDLVLDEERMEARVADQPPCQLTATEFRILRYLMNHPDKVVSKSELTAHVYDFDGDRDSNVLEVYITRLRKRIGRERIATLRGRGYRLTSSAGDGEA